MNAERECRRCGSCCREGGPALHSVDRDLVTSGSLNFDKLITIRKGELVTSPEVGGGLKATGVELVKIKGKKGRWTCYFYDDEVKGCTRYEARPSACATLKCWDTAGIMELMEKDTLSRMDLLPVNSNAARLVCEYEELVPCPDFEHLAAQKKQGGIADELKEELTEKIKTDLLYRTRMAKDHNMGLDDELFLFGRPLFQLLQPFGAKVFDTPKGIEVLWK